MTVLWVALAGSAGAVARFVVDGCARARWGAADTRGTLLVNVTGSLLLGVLVGLVLRDAAPQSLVTVVGTGFCGGYTTFGTAGLETVRLMQRRRYRRAALHAGVGLALPVAAAALGLLVATRDWPASTW